MRVELLGTVTDSADYLGGVEKIKSSKKLYGNKNRLLYYLDQGVLFHYAELYDSSLYYLQEAEKVIDELYAKSVTNEAAALLTNDLMRPYRGRRYERILLHQFIAFNYLAKGELDEALVESRKVELVFDEFRSKDKLVQKYQNDGLSNYMSSIIYDAQGERDNALISLYKAVRAYRESPVPLPDEVNDMAYYMLNEGDRAEDVTQLELEPVEQRENIEALADSGSEIILVGYAGKAPTLGETVFTGTYVVGGLLVGTYQSPNGEFAHVRLPAPPLPVAEVKKIEEGEKTKAGTTMHIKFSLPTPVERESQTEYFVAYVDSTKKAIRSEMVSDNNRLLAGNIDDNAHATLLRTTIRTVLRTIAAQKTKEQMTTSSPMGNLLLNLGTDILTDQIERADTRLCFLFPQTVHITRIPVTPGQHRIKAFAKNSSSGIVGKKEWQTVSVKKGEKKFIFFPSAY